MKIGKVNLEFKNKKKCLKNLLRDDRNFGNGQNFVYREEVSNKQVKGALLEYFQGLLANEQL